MQRLFVAIRPPSDIRAILLAAMGGISAARWQSDAQLHLTLRFIGEVDRHLASDVRAALASVHHPGFEIALDGVGAFEKRGRVDAVWAGVTPHAPLRALHKKIDQALLRVGVEPDRRAYLPHITLARLSRHAGSVGGFVGLSGGLSSTSFRIDGFALFESQLAPEGAVYGETARYSLD
ncbi:MAG: RNA 2',3'-cyclic phosphodiesterase [Sphingomonas sp.]|nr:RNA 2',3'-cyclic phosphodiesterase [Sphingomonas sp.]